MWERVVYVHVLSCTYNISNCTSAIFLNFRGKYILSAYPCGLVWASCSLSRNRERGWFFPVGKEQPYRACVSKETKDLNSFLTPALA